MSDAFSYNKVTLRQAEDPTASLVSVWQSAL